MILEDATYEAFRYEVWELSYKSNKPVLTACELCGELKVTSKHYYHTFCLSCSHILGEKLKGKKNCNYGKRGKDTNGYKGGPIKCNCLYCGKEFEVTKYKTKHGGGKYCSRKCMHDAKLGKNHHMYGKRGEKSHSFKGGLTKCVCLYCGKEFYGPQSGIRRGQHKYCSNKCYAEAHTGKNNGRWNGGISFEPYCIKFNKAYKEMIRERFGNVCFLCAKTEQDNGKALCVHHVNYNKNCGCDETKCICVPLCMRCHTKTNSDREFWQCLIMEMLKPFVAWESN